MKEDLDSLTLAQDAHESSDELAMCLQARQRLQAEYANYRRRSAASLNQEARSHQRRLALALLPALDALASATSTLGDSSSPTSGFSQVRRLLLDALETEGLVEISPVLVPFDPTIHDAVEQSDLGQDLAGLVTETLRPGYLFDGVLLRPAMVRVGKH